MGTPMILLKISIQLLKPIALSLDLDVLIFDLFNNLIMTKKRVC
jgi:hypothetical protein